MLQETGGKEEEEEEEEVVVVVVVVAVAFTRENRGGSAQGRGGAVYSQASFLRKRVRGASKGWRL